jgi:signal peptidase I
MRIGKKIAIGLSAVIMVGLASSLGLSWKMPSGSMIPTFPVGSRFFVNRFRTSAATSPPK